MMFKQQQDNPVFQHLTSNPRWPSLRLTWWIFIGLGVLSLTLTVSNILFDPYNIVRMHPWYITIAVFIFGLSIMLFSGPLTAIICIQYMMAITRSDHFVLMRISILSPVTIFRGYIGAILVRLRLLWALALGLIPSVFVAIVQFKIYEIVIPDDLDHGIYRISPFVDDAISIALWWMACGILYFLMTNTVAISASIWLPLRWKQTGVAIGTALIILMVSIPAVIGMVWLLTGEDVVWSLVLVIGIILTGSTLFMLYSARGYIGSYI